MSPEPETVVRAAGMAAAVAALAVVAMVVISNDELPAAPPPPSVVNNVRGAPVGDYRNRPVPLSVNAPTALDYHVIPVDLSDPRAREPLVELGGAGIAGQSYYARTDHANHPYDRPIPGAPADVRCRWSVASRLWQVNSRLRRYGVELFVLDGYRPIECQRELWRYFLTEAKRQLPRASEKELVRYAGRYCSNPSDFNENDYRTWPVHITGGAIDLTLRTTNGGRLLDMGSPFDGATKGSHSDYLERQEGDNEEASVKTARMNRRLLYWAMIDAGFTNYPYEWWHYDFGDQMYAMHCRVKPTEFRMIKAFYGPAMTYAR